MLEEGHGALVEEAFPGCGPAPVSRHAMGDALAKAASQFGREFGRDAVREAINGLCKGYQVTISHVILTVLFMVLFMILIVVVPTIEILHTMALLYLDSKLSEPGLAVAADACLLQHPEATQALPFVHDSHENAQQSIRSSVGLETGNASRQLQSVFSSMVAASRSRHYIILFAVVLPLILACFIVWCRIRARKEATRRKKAFEIVWDLGNHAAWYTANNHAGNHRDGNKDLKHLDKTHRDIRNNFCGREELKKLADEAKEMAVSYGWHCNNDLHGSPNATADHEQFLAHRDKAKSLLHHSCSGAVAQRADAIFDNMELMIRKICWACAHCRRWSKNLDNSKAVAAKGKFLLLLDDASSREEWPLY